jgi:hypothetical protein
MPAAGRQTHAMAAHSFGESKNSRIDLIICCNSCIVSDYYNGKGLVARSILDFRGRGPGGSTSSSMLEVLFSAVQFHKA